MFQHISKCINGKGCDVAQKQLVIFAVTSFLRDCQQAKEIERQDWTRVSDVSIAIGRHWKSCTLQRLLMDCTMRPVLPFVMIVTSSHTEVSSTTAAPFFFRSSVLAIIQCNWLCYSRLFGDCLFFFGRKSRNPSSPSETSALTEAPPSSTRMTQPTPILTHASQKLDGRRASQPMTLTSLGESLREAILSRRSADINKDGHLPDKTVPRPDGSHERVAGRRKVQIEDLTLPSDSEKNGEVSCPETRAMDTDEWRTRGQEMVEYIADYMDTIAERRVTPSIEPGYLKPLLPEVAPYKPESWDRIMEDFEKYIMPGVTHWQHPRFHAYFPAGNSYPSILADMLTDAIGCIGFSWVSPKSLSCKDALAKRNFFYRLRVPCARN